MKSTPVILFTKSAAFLTCHFTAIPNFLVYCYMALLARMSTVKELNVSLTMHHELAIYNYQRDALNIIYSSNIITLLYMFRVSSTHIQEDIVVHKQHMVPSLCKR